MGFRALRIALGIVAAAVVMVAGILIVTAVREQASPHSDGETIAAGDVVIAYREWGPSTGMPVLLVHGSFAWSQTWDVIAPNLAAKGYRIIAFDIPPFGYSSRPADSDYSRAAQAQRMLEAADALGLDRFALVGHSFGAGAVMEAALLSPERITGLALLAGALSLDDPRGGGALASAAALPVIGTAIAAATFTNPAFTEIGLKSFVHDDGVVVPERVAVYQAPLDVKGTASATAAWLAGGLFSDESRSLSVDTGNYRAFEPDTLLLWGAEDAITPVSQAQDLHSLLRTSRLVVLPGVGHIPHLESPQAVVRELDAFLGPLTGEPEDQSG